MSASDDLKKVRETVARHKAKADTFPSTPLPWELDGETLKGGQTHIATFCGSLTNDSLAQDARYTRHACNAHQKLVAALRRILNNPEARIGGDIRCETVALLRDLGEL
jgi:hypothetical protein